MVLKMLHSPLAGTAAVLAALGLLAVPLHRLTSARPVPPAQRSAAKPCADDLTPAILRLKLLTPRPLHPPQNRGWQNLARSN